MKACRHLIFALVLVAAAFILPQRALASIMVSYGNQPVQNFGWPEGALALANLETRVGYWVGPPFGGGEFHFLYRGDKAALDAALKKFAAIHVPVLEAVLHDGPGSDQFLAMPRDGNQNPDGRVDWSFTIWVPENWKNLYNNPKVTFNTNDPDYGKPLPPPRMDVYVGAGGLDWSNVAIPPNVHVRDERASASGLDPKAEDQGETIMNRLSAFMSYRDADSGTIFYVESDLHHVAALDKEGKVLWCRLPALDGNLPPYSRSRPMTNPAINWIGGLREKESERLKKVGGGKFIGIRFNSRQAGVLDMKNGDFTFEGQD